MTHGYLVADKLPGGICTNELMFLQVRGFIVAAKGGSKWTHENH